MIIILFTLGNFRVTILTLSISYLHLRENLKTGMTSKVNFNSPIIYITNLHKFHTRFLKRWKQILRENRVETCAICLNHYLIKNYLLLSLVKLTLKELYSILISNKKKNSVPASRQYFNSLFPDSNFKFLLLNLISINNLIPIQTLIFLSSFIKIPMPVPLQSSYCFKD